MCGAVGVLFSLGFSPFRQCAPVPHKVRPDSKSLPILCFLHIAGIGDGA
jgi:hypothetical protein